MAKFIFAAKDAEVPGKVLMHCTDCEELAPAFVLAYMLIASFEKHKKLALKDAMTHVSKKKSEAKSCEMNPNNGFMSKLIALERKLFGTV